MIEFTPFRAGHLTYFTPQPAQAGEHTALIRSGGAEMLERSLSLSGWAGNRCLGAAGLIPIRPHRAVAWLILSGDAAPYMLAIARKARRVVLASAFKRVELTVAEGNTQGFRFAEMIGAVRETPEPMRFYGADGGGEYLYAIIRG